MIHSSARSCACAYVTIAENSLPRRTGRHRDDTRETTVHHQVRHRLQLRRTTRQTRQEGIEILTARQQQTLHPLGRRPRRIDVPHIVVRAEPHRTQPLALHLHREQPALHERHPEVVLRQMVTQALVHIDQIIDRGLVPHREERLVQQQPQLGVQRRTHRSTTTRRLQEVTIGTRQPEPQILLDPLHLRLGHRHTRLRQTEMRRPRLLQRPRPPLPVIHRSRRHPTVMPQQRLHLDRNQLQPPRTRHVMPRPTVRRRHIRHRVPQLVPRRRQRRVRRHIVRQPQLVDTETLRRLRDLHRHPRIRREIRETPLVHPHTPRMTRRPHRIREVHHLPGIRRVRRHGPSRRLAAGRCPQPEPTCRHGGCPLRRSLRPERRCPSRMPTA
ncbi:hypothetical protein SGPA1_50993 [Streptomyces misionensis JCM 4497]